jgi:hypothetical protein
MVHRTCQIVTTFQIFLERRVLDAWKIVLEMDVVKSDEKKLIIIQTILKTS